MPGLFNVENALGVIAVCHALHVPPAAVYDGLVRARVPGRMETYTNADGSLHAIVDYAHNRLSFETLFRSVRAEYPGREMAIVFGCPGKRRTTAAGIWARPPATGATGSISPRRTAGRRDTLDICREIAPNVEKAGCPVRIIPNRGEAHPSGGAGLRRTLGAAPHRQRAGDPPEAGTAYIDTPTDVEYVQAFPPGVRPAPGAGPGESRPGHAVHPPRPGGAAGGALGGLLPLQSRGRPRPGTPPP